MTGFNISVGGGPMSNYVLAFAEDAGATEGVSEIGSREARGIEQGP